MRVRLTAPRWNRIRFRYLDSLHGALVNAWTACGATSENVVGHGAKNWSFGAVGTATSQGFLLKSLVVGAEGPLEPTLARLLPETIRKESVNGDKIDLSAWDKSADNFPLIAGPGSTATLSAIMLSPLAISTRGKKDRWHQDLSRAMPVLDAAINTRLSRLTGRNVNLHVEPDRLYLRANPRHSVVVPTRTTHPRKTVFVVGMLCPLTLSGSLQDLRSAWRLGIGEKNRNGFGCIGSIAQ